MSSRAIFLLVLLSGLLPSTVVLAEVSDSTPGDFAYGLSIDTPGDATAYRVKLPLDVYRRAVRVDLGDVRVFNGEGRAAPYALRRPETDTPVRAPAQRLPLFALRGDMKAALDAIRVTIEFGRAAVDVQTQGEDATQDRVRAYLADARTLKVPVSALQFDWPAEAAEFAGRLIVEASDDLDSWRTLAHAAPLANLRANEARLIERRIEFPATKAKFWRLSWVGAAAPFALSGVLAEPAVDRVEVRRETLPVLGSAVPGKPREFIFDLGVRLPVDRLNIELPEVNTIVQLSLFSRAEQEDDWRPVIRSGFYRLRRAEAELRNNPVAISPNMHRYWRIVLDEGSAFGTGQPTLRVGWVPHEVVFLPRGLEPFVLAFGSGSVTAAEAPLSVIPQDVVIQEASIVAPRVLGGEGKLEHQADPFPWKATFLWAALVLGVLLLGWMAYRLSRDLNRPS